MKALSRNDLLLMGLLIDRPMHGYELSEVLSGPGFGPWVKMGRTSVYYTLGRLERDELVTKHGERHGDKPERSVFSITDEGRKRFFGALEGTLRTPTERISEFDVAIFYSNRLEPDVTRAAIQDRAAILAERINETTDSLSESRESANLAVHLVLEHHLSALNTERAFLEHMLGLYTTERFEHALGALAGSLSDTMFHEVLRTLASAKRSGTLRVMASGHTVDFALHRGTLYGIAPDVEIGESRSLEVAFTSGQGEYEFLPADERRLDVVEVGEIDEVILKGCRAVSASTAFKHMLPDPQILLDVTEGVDIDRIEAVLTAEERELLRAVDGVKSMPELARRLGMEETQVVRGAYALWATGWLVRTGPDKRDLVIAVAAYAQRWVDAAELFAGGTMGSLALDRAVMKGCPSRFPVGTDISMFDYPEPRSELASTACDFIECLLETVAGVLGESFVNDVMNGYAARLSETQKGVLLKHRAAPDRVIASLAAQTAGHTWGRRP